MSKYLYGASVQGIQGFIFETNKLREIAGASELVEQICTTEFILHLEKELKPTKYNEDSKLILAAGNIKYIFDSFEDCQKVVDSFAKKVMEIAPGITISQAVVKYKGDEPSKDDINLLEERLKTQRNKAIRQHGLGLMISERSRSTGNSGISWSKNKKEEKSVVIDAAQVVKQKASNKSKNSLMEKLVGDYRKEDKYYPFEMEHLVDNQQNEWIAVVHADGNSLGLLIQEMVKSIEDNGKSVKEGFSEFSKQLDAATTKAANDAFEKVIKEDYENRIAQDQNNKRRLPIRPVVIGGDDLTVIIRGDLAIDFTNEFLNAFQERTEEYFSELVTDYNLDEFKNGLTACAGIVYIKPSYPFHYAVDLAEELCSFSKKKAKEIDDVNVPSCLTFHKVQSSFVEDYNTIIERELKAGDIYLNAGPYSTDKNFAQLRTVKKLKEQVSDIKRASSPKSNLRNWLSELHVNTNSAEQLMNRTKTITKPYHTEILELDKAIVIIKENGKEERRTHINDILTIASIEKN